jgi:hypothetical protein
MYYLDPFINAGYFFIVMLGPVMVAFLALAVYAVVRIHFGDRFYAREKELTPEELEEVKRGSMRLPQLKGSEASGTEYTRLELFNPNLTKFQEDAIGFIGNIAMYLGLAVNFALMALIIAG